MIESRIDLYKHIMTNGQVLSPRGQKIKEVRDVQFCLDPSEPFDPYTARNYPVDYFKKEMIWKLSADPYNHDIMNHAKLWASVLNPDNTFNSNYGVFWFGQQMGLIKAYMELLRDTDSRRAVIPMLNDSHLAPGVKDTVCTESVTFHIRDSALYMSVHMRSSDIWSGLGTECGPFCFLYRLMWSMLNMHCDIMTGNIVITAASSHAYERNWDKINQIIEAQEVSNPSIMPWGDGLSNLSLIAARGQKPKDMSTLATWLFS